MSPSTGSGETIKSPLKECGITSTGARGCTSEASNEAELMYLIFSLPCALKKKWCNYQLAWQKSCSVSDPDWSKKGLALVHVCFETLEFSALSGRV